MQNLASSDPSALIRRAQNGETDVLSVLIDQYRPYLKLLARLRRDPRLAAKLDDSDLVQEASALAAVRFAEFRGTTEGEFTAWLRTNMARVVAQSLRHFTRQRRDVQLEQDLERSYDRSSALLAASLPQTREPSPSDHVMGRERAVLVAEALDRLPAHYREIIILRDFQSLTFEDVSRRTGRSSDSTRKMWARAVVMLRQALGGKL